MFGCLFLYVEDIGMAVRAVEPLHVRLVREYRRRDHRPFSLQQELLFEFNWFRFVLQKNFRLYQAILHSTDPVDPVSVGRPRQVTGIGEFLLPILYITVMAFFAVLPGMSESDSTVVARPAVLAVPVTVFSYLRRVTHHIEPKLQMTHIARIFQAMTPV